MLFIKDIFKNKDTYTGKIDATIFCVNLFIIFVHLVLMVCYIILKHNFMIIVNTFSLLYYVTSYKICVTKRDKYVSFSYIEIWIHTLLAIGSFGWAASFQNWIFGLVAAAFLPSFRTSTYKVSLKKSFIFAMFLMFTYFLFAFIIYRTGFKIEVEVPYSMIVFLFIFNNIIAFFTVILFALTYTDNTTRKELELTRKADFDELTGIYNRHALDEIGATIVKKCKETHRAYSVAILDADYFKKVNDTYGHTSGDLVLKELANILKEYSNENIIVGRWGGEEFIIIATHEIRYNNFVSLLKKIRAQISKHKFTIENDKKIKLTVSIGSSAIYSNKPLEEAVSVADNNLYKAKQKGRNRVIG